jgi:hypothetical protein
VPSSKPAKLRLFQTGTNSRLADVFIAQQESEFKAKAK